ncbi:MAG: hypothetical protein JXB48_14640 [Candidatus Latescibacteria bacterium]|nr:hypothetical protein [Candidatus Latescibacterota bacterium]
MERNEELLKRYNTLLGLYSELEVVSGRICDALESGQSFAKVAGILREKKVLVERIEQESLAISSMKKIIAGGQFLSEDERERVKVAERNLTEVVTRVIDQGKKTYDLMAKHGVKVTRN